MTHNTPNETPRPDLSLDAAAVELSCSRMHVYRLVKAGKLQAYKVGHITRIRRECLDALKDGNPWKPLAQRASSAAHRTA